MDGGRGCGRGKGKKKAARQKKAAAVAAAAVSHKKTPKKVAAAHSSVQVVAVSKSTPPPAHSSNDATHQQGQSKAKRKRVRAKAAGPASSLLKKQQQTAPVTSPKKAAVLTPVTAQPHVVSLTGKKKKRKKHAVLSDVASTEAAVAAAVAAATAANAALPKENNVTTATGKKIVTPKTQKTKKNAGVIHLPVSSPSAVTPAAASPRRTVSSSTPKDMTSSATTDGTMTTPSPKTGKAASSKKSTKKTKAKTAAAAIKAKDDDGPAETPAASLPTKASQLTTKSLLPDQAVKHSAVAINSPTPPSPNAGNPAVPARALKVETADIESQAQRHSQLSQQESKSDMSATPVSMAAKTPTFPGPTNVSMQKASLKRKLSASQAAVDSELPSKRITPPEQLSTPPIKSDEGHEMKMEVKTPAVVGHSRKTETQLPVASEKQTKLAAEPTSKVGPVETKPSPASSAASVNQPKVAVKPESKPIAVPAPAIAASTAAPPAIEPFAAETKEKTFPIPADTSAQPIIRDNGGHNASDARDAAPVRAVQKSPEVAVKVEARTPAVGDPSHKAPLRRLDQGPKAKNAKEATHSQSEVPPKTEKIGIIMDSHSYVERMMRGELDSKVASAKVDHHPAVKSEAALSPRPTNVWGASFGMVAPALTALTPPQSLSTTPLSTWFLSKGSANFMKKVHFSDDEGDDEEPGNQLSLISAAGTGPHSFSAATPRKSRTPRARKNAFLESLAKQSNWRSWYGEVDLSNLLDPPLAQVPDKLQSHEVAIPNPLENDLEVEVLTGKNNSALQRLEADIRREKRRGSAFGEQLLRMLQGKTVSGKSLEEEYGQVIEHT